MMEGLLTLFFVGAAIYIAFKVFMAAMSGLGKAGSEIADSWPRFFAKVWTSVIIGVVAGSIAQYLIGSFPISLGAAGIVATGKFMYDIFTHRS
jgi:hypothetical protein